MTIVIIKVSANALLTRCMTTADYRPTTAYKSANSAEKQ